MQYRAAALLTLSLAMATPALASETCAPLKLELWDTQCFGLDEAVAELWRLPWDTLWELTPAALGQSDVQTANRPGDLLPVDEAIQPNGRSPDAG